MSHKTFYIWRCGKQRAILDIGEEDMAAINADEFGIRKLLSEVSRALGYGNDHTHVFSTNPKSPEGIVIFDCPCAGKVRP